ncbi:hypothetical protein AeMF1_021857 [Aphanomyces euteiches]|nr:hypothetical protein AeMF1_021857 [Aphanomyces euteiches]
MCGVAQDIVYPKVAKAATAAAASPSMSKGVASKPISTDSAPTYAQSNQWLQRHAAHGGNNQGYQPNSPNHGKHSRPPCSNPFPTDSASDSPFPTDSPSTDSPSTDVPSTYSPPTDAPSSSMSPPTPAPSTP